MYYANTTQLEVRVKTLEDIVKKLEEEVFKKSIRRVRVRKMKKDL
jgi:proteasome assembly chaperone (PAC2) family protein